MFQRDCPDCQGTGTVPDYCEEAGDVVEYPCRMCGATGRVWWWVALRDWARYYAKRDIKFWLRKIRKGQLPWRFHPDDLLF